MKIIEKIINAFLVVQHKKIQVKNITFLDNGQGMWICPYISRHLLSLNPLQARCRRYSRGER
nr:hypothetical protein DS993_23100 [Escherichia coli]